MRLVSDGISRAIQELPILITSPRLPSRPAHAAKPLLDIEGGVSEHRPMNSANWKIVIGSLVGGLAVNVALAACQNVSDVNHGPGNAHAQTADCNQWEVTYRAYTEEGIQAVGWEPFGGSELFWLRRCVSE